MGQTQTRNVSKCSFWDVTRASEEAVRTSLSPLTYSTIVVKLSMNRPKIAYYTLKSHENISHVQHLDFPAPFGYWRRRND